MLLNELSKWLGRWDSVPEVEIDVIRACRADSVAKYSGESLHLLSYDTDGHSAWRYTKTWQKRHF